MKGRLLGFGVDDSFMHEIGSQEYARAKYGLTADNIAAKVEAAFRKTAG
jgi:transketolase